MYSYITYSIIKATESVSSCSSILTFELKALHQSNQEETDDHIIDEAYVVVWRTAELFVQPPLGLAWQQRT